MRDLNKVANKCLDMLDELAIPYGYVREFKVNTRAHRRWGQCHKEGDVYEININVELLDENVPLESLEDTLLHELLHTCPNCMNHGKEWQMWANMVNNHYGYNIKRCTSMAEKGVDIEEHRKLTARENKWSIKCSCGAEWLYKRKPTRFRINDNGYLPNATCPYCHSKALYIVAL